MSFDDIKRGSSPYRRRSSPRDSSPYRRPPHDTRRSAPSAPSVGMQIRGLASGQENYRRREGSREDGERSDHRNSSNGYRNDHDRQRSRSPREWERRGYRDRDKADYRSPRSPEPSSPAYDTRTSSARRAHERTPDYGGSPSRELMLEGLPPDMTEEDIKLELQTGYKVGRVDNIRVIRQRGTGVSRGFGFICFPSLEESTDFMHSNHPTIQLYGSATNARTSEAATIRILYSRERGAPDRSGGDSEWICLSCSALNYSRRVECFRCKSAKELVAGSGSQAQGKAAQFTNTGDSDVSPKSTPSQYLLFRSLEPSVTEELLARGAAKLLRSEDAQSNQDSLLPATHKVMSTSTVIHAGARPGSIRRVLLVRDRQSDESWRYGFVEFAGVEDAQAALAKWNSFEKFTISSKPVLVSHIHAGVFVPVFKQLAPGQEHFAFTPSTNPALKVAYWDQDAYVKELFVSTGESDDSVTAPEKSKDGTKKTKKRRAEAAPTGTTKKALPIHLEFWTTRHNELHGKDASTTLPSTSSSDSPSHAASTTTQITEISVPPSRSYADPNKHCCYLCSRQFKSATEVNKHERLSNLHQNNLKDNTLVTQALGKLEKAGITPVTASSAIATSTKKEDEEAEGQQEYRDRAKERRVLFNQPKQPGSKGQGTGRRASPDKTASTSTHSTPAQTAAADLSPKSISISKGASLMTKLGYKAGSGLGASGDGLTAPIETNLYAAGVGLGAVGGKMGDAVEHATRNTKGEEDRGEFARRTKEKARERFEGMA